MDELGEHHEIIKDGLFGVHMKVKFLSGNESVRKITYPLFQGMAHVSGQYWDDITLTVTANGTMEVMKVRDDIWAPNRRASSMAK